jgi:outer membrane receptor protein involved in Fe transport
VSIFVNTGRERARGIEAELSGRWPRGFGGRIGYAAVIGEDTETGLELTNSPEHMVRGSLEAPVVPGKLFLGAAVSYLSPRLTLARRRTEAVFTLDLSLAGADFFHGLAASAGVRNLLDRRYSDPGSVEHRMDRIEQDGRRLWLSAGYDLD